MIINKTKPEGQQILNKLRSKGHVWLTVPDLGYRVKFVLSEKGNEATIPNEACKNYYPINQPMALVLLNQKLHAMWFHCYPRPYSFTNPAGPVHFSGGDRAYIKEKYIFAWAVEAYER